MKRTYQTFNYNAYYCKEKLENIQEEGKKESEILNENEEKKEDVEGKTNLLKKLFLGEFKEEKIVVEVKEDRSKFQFVKEEFPDLVNEIVLNDVSSNIPKNSSKKHNKKQKQKFEELNIDIFKKDETA